MFVCLPLHSSQSEGGRNSAVNNVFRIMLYIMAPAANNIFMEANMKILITAIFLLFITIDVKAEMKYNTYEKRWENAPSGSELKYNRETKEYKYTTQDSELKYNRNENRFESAEPDSELKYNSYEKEYQYAPKDSELKYNRYEKKWGYTK
jgi:hypothetical protein